MTKDEEANKTIHSLVTGGEGCWHEWINMSEAYEFTRWECLHCEASDGRNPDYLKNPADFVTLLTFCITEWGGWELFLAKHFQAYLERTGMLKGAYDSLLHPIDALGRAVCEYLKEKK